ncbi:hypothetical protein ABPG75_005670 [Micractinium tetrahymenae]
MASPPPPSPEQPAQLADSPLPPPAAPQAPPPGLLNSTVSETSAKSAPGPAGDPKVTKPGPPTSHINWLALGLSLGLLAIIAAAAAIFCALGLSGQRCVCMACAAAICSQQRAAVAAASRGQPRAAKRVPSARVLPEAQPAAALPNAEAARTASLHHEQLPRALSMSA